MQLNSDTYQQHLGLKDQLKKGELYSVKNPETGKWCRARLDSLEKEICRVSFVDYGGTVSVPLSETCKMPPSSIRLIRSLAIPCTVDFPKPLPKDPSQMAKLQQLFVDSTGGSCRAKFSEEKKEIKKIVSLYAGDKDVLNFY